MEVELKPCPFCGSIPTIHSGPEHSWIGGRSKDLIIECCVRMSMPYGFWDGEAKPKELALEALAVDWNRRV